MLSHKFEVWYFAIKTLMGCIFVSLMMPDARAFYVFSGLLVGGWWAGLTDASPTGIYVRIYSITYVYFIYNHIPIHVYM